MRRRRFAARLAAAGAGLQPLCSAPLQPQAPAPDVHRLLADLPRQPRQAIERLEQTFSAGHAARARQEIKAHVGTVTAEADERQIRLYSEHGAMAATLLRTAGGSAAGLYGSGSSIRTLLATLPRALAAPLGNVALPPDRPQMRAIAPRTARKAVRAPKRRPVDHSARITELQAQVARIRRHLDPTLGVWNFGLTDC